MDQIAQIEWLARIFRFILPLVVGWILLLMFKDSNRQLIAFSKYSPLTPKAFLYGLNSLTVYSLQFDNTIGRSSKQCDIVLPDETVSRAHARITYHDGRWEITDLGSSNGTKVNQQPVQQAALTDGSIVSFGEAAFTFTTRRNDPAGAKPPAGKRKEGRRK